MHITPPAQYPLRHSVDRVVHAQLWVLLDHSLCQNEFQTAGLQTVDVPMLIASVPCAVEEGLGDHGRH